MQGQASISFSGRLADHPELRHAPSGVPVCTIVVMDEPRQYNRNTGKWEDGESTPWRVTCFNALAEHVAASCPKGARVMVTGTVHRESYEKDGEKRFAWKVIAEDIGVSLRWTDAKVVKFERRSDREIQAGAPQPDPWATV